MTSAELNAKILGHAINIGIAAGGVLPATNDPWWLAGRVGAAAVAVAEVELKDPDRLSQTDYQILVGELGHLAAAGHFHAQPPVDWRNARQFDASTVCEAIGRANAANARLREGAALSLGNAAADFLARLGVSDAAKTRAAQAAADESERES